MLNLLILLECLKELFFIVLVGGFMSILSAGIVIYTIVKVLGISEILDMEDEDDYILTKDDEKIPYDDETQE
jgi:hypothetical protein